ncbi:MAG: hypothetical protein LBC04_01770 [Holosporaceae bacterium]|jgi:hypothetical protein|nr:hypothetical protein [Holosporaceae bacterium]
MKLKNYSYTAAALFLCFFAEGNCMMPQNPSSKHRVRLSALSQKLEALPPDDWDNFFSMLSRQDVNAILSNGAVERVRQDQIFEAVFYIRKLNDYDGIFVVTVDELEDAIKIPSIAELITNLDIHCKKREITLRLLGHIHDGCPNLTLVHLPQGTKVPEESFAQVNNTSDYMPIRH